MEFNDLTLLVPVRDRQYNLTRILEHYKDLDCQKIIVDSSAERYEGEDTVGDFGFKYDYYGPTHYPELKYRMSEKIQTEFVIDCADDDLILLSSIKRGVEFLRKNKDYVAFYGEELWFDPKHRHIFNKIPDVHFRELSEQFHSKNSIERLKFHCVPNSGRAHCLHRIEHFQEANAIVYNNSQLHPICWAENILIMLTAIGGNTKIFPCVWNVRYVGERLLESLSEKELWGSKGQKEESIEDNLDFHHLKPICEVLSTVSKINLDNSYEFIKNIFIEANDPRWCQSRQGPSRNYDYHQAAASEVEKIIKMMMEENQ